MVRLVKACLVTACLGLAVMLRSGPLIWVMASCGQVSRLSLGKVRPGRLSYGVLGLGGFVAARFGEFR